MRAIEKIKPSILISEMFYFDLEREQNLPEIMDRLSDSGYYRAVEIGTVNEAASRAEVKKRVEKNGWQLTQWITKDLLDRGINPSSTDRGVHLAALQRIKELAKIARECGAANLALISGEDPGPALRGEAWKNFAEVVRETCLATEGTPDLNLLIEPLDRFAHKRNLIGPTEEAVEFVAVLKNELPRVYFSWDSAHVALNREDLLQSLEQCAPFVSQIHLANAVTDERSERYGDWHMPMGAPGFLDDACAASLMRSAAAMHLAEEIPHFASVERRMRKGEDPWKIESECRAFLDRALQQTLDESEREPKP